MLRLQGGVKIRPEGSNGGEWHTVEQPRGHRQQQGDLRGQGERLRLRLLQDGTDAASSLPKARPVGGIARGSKLRTVPAMAPDRVASTRITFP